jgi:SulP family sulfate permease
MDATALNRLEGLHHRLRRHGRHLILSGPHTQPYALMETAGFFAHLGRNNVVADLAGAMVRARELLANEPASGPSETTPAA